MNRDVGALVGPSIRWMNRIGRHAADYYRTYRSCVTGVRVFIRATSMEVAVDTSNQGCALDGQQHRPPKASGCVTPNRYLRVRHLANTAFAPELASGFDAEVGAMTPTDVASAAVGIER